MEGHRERVEERGRAEGQRLFHRGGQLAAGRDRRDSLRRGEAHQELPAAGRDGEPAAGLGGERERFGAERQHRERVVERQTELEGQLGALLGAHQPLRDPRDADGGGGEIGRPAEEPGIGQHAAQLGAAHLDLVAIAGGTEGVRRLRAAAVVEGDLGDQEVGGQVAARERELRRCRAALADRVVLGPQRDAGDRAVDRRAREDPGPGTALVAAGAGQAQRDREGARRVAQEARRAFERAARGALDLGLEELRARRPGERQAAGEPGRRTARHLAAVEPEHEARGVRVEVLGDRLDLAFDAERRRRLETQLRGERRGHGERRDHGEREGAAPAAAAGPGRRGGGRRHRHRAGAGVSQRARTGRATISPRRAGPPRRPARRRGLL